MDRNKLIRTDNDIKNHFYSTLRRSLRRINKKIGDDDSTNKIKEIKPGVLSKMYEWFIIENSYPTDDEEIQ